MKLAPTTEDFESLGGLALEYHASAPEFFGSLNPRKTFERLALAVANDAAFVIKDDKIVVGALVLEEIANWWSDDAYLSDLFFYITPKYRSFANARALLVEAKEYAKMKGKRLEITLFNPDDLDRKEVLMARLGFKKIQANYTSGD